MDISQFCNICSSKENVGNICTEEKTILKSILLLLIEKKTSIDENNIYICAVCCDKLQDIYEFKQLCVNNLLHCQKIYKQKLQRIQSVENIIKDEPVEEWIEKVTGEPIDLIKNQENLTCNSSHFIDTKIKNEISEDNGQNEVAEKQNIHTEIDLGTMDDNVIIKKQETRECGESPKNESLHQDEEINNFVPNTTKYFEFVSSDKTPESQSKIQSEFSCTYCDKIYQTKEYLINHELVHTADKHYKCDVCEKAFQRTAQLDLHKRLHTGETPYKCTECGKSFRSPRMLTRHSHVHTGEKPYKCSMCDKSFIDLPYLKMHYLVHTGETPYKCDVCDASFKNPSNLNRHKRLHTGEKPFHCKFCPKAFSNSAHLTRHLHVHTGERPHECRICNKKFVTSSEVKQHHRRSH